MRLYRAPEAVASDRSARAHRAVHASEGQTGGTRAVLAGRGAKDCRSGLPSSLVPHTVNRFGVRCGQSSDPSPTSRGRDGSQPFGARRRRERITGLADVRGGVGVNAHADERASQHAQPMAGADLMAWDRPIPIAMATGTGGRGAPAGRTGSPLHDQEHQRTRIRTGSGRSRCSQEAPPQARRRPWRPPSGSQTM
jgi:hypothetical protein